MKIVQSKYPNAAPVVPIRGGYRCQFENSLCTMPNDVADTLVAMSGGFYTIVHHDLAAITNGAKILIIRDAGLGDLLLITPMIRRLHEDMGAIVDVLTLEKHRCLFEGNPHVRDTFALEKDTTDRKAYDVVLDLRLIVENAEAAGIHNHRADAFAEFADVKLFAPEDRQLDYYPEEGERSAARDVIKQTGCYSNLPKDRRPVPKGFIAYVWRSTTPNRNWSDETHGAVINALAAAGYCAVLLDHALIDPARLWNAGISERVQRDYCINRSGGCSIRDTAALIAECDAVITPDTGLFHLAGALNKPTLTYFGAFPVEERHTHRRLTVVNNPKSCALGPCRTYRCLNRDENGQSVCLAVDPALVVSRLKELLDVDSILERSAPNRNPDAQASEIDNLEAGDGHRGLGQHSAAGDPVQHSAPIGEAGKPKRRRRTAIDSRPLLPTDEQTGIGISG